MAQAFGQSPRLDGNDLIAAAFHFRFPVGDKGMPRVFPRRFFGARNRFEGDHPSGSSLFFRIVAERGLRITRPCDAGQVRIGAVQSALGAETRRIKQDRPVFRDEAMAAEDRVGGRFPASGGGIGISGNASRALLGHEAAAVGGLADQLVAGRGVENEGRPGQRLTAARGDDAPQVFAEFDADDQLAVRFEKQIRPEGNGRPGEVRLGARNVPAAGKMAFLVEFPVIGQEALGNDPFDGTVLEHDGGVEDPPLEADRTPDDDDGLRPGAGRRDFSDRIFALVEKTGLEKQIPAGIPRESQFGKKNDRSLIFDAPSDQADGLLRVETDVRDPQLRHGGGDPVKAEHGAPSFRLKHAPPI